MPQRWDSAAGRARRHRTGCKLCPARSLSRSGSTDEGQPCRHRSTTIRLERGSVLGKPSTAIANTLGQASLPAECTAEELLTKVGAGSIPRAKAGKLTVYVCMSVINSLSHTYPAWLRSLEGSKEHRRVSPGPRVAKEPSKGVATSVAIPRSVGRRLQIACSAAVRRHIESQVSKLRLRAVHCCGVWSVTVNCEPHASCVMCKLLCYLITPFKTRLIAVMCVRLREKTEHKQQLFWGFVGTSGSSRVIEDWR